MCVKKDIWHKNQSLNWDKCTTGVYWDKAELLRHVQSGWRKQKGVYSKICTFKINTLETAWDVLLQSAFTLGYHRDTAEVRNNPLRNQTSASEFCSAGSGVKIIIWLHPKLTPQKKFHKPGRHYQDKVNAAWRTVPSGVVGCTACPPTTPGKENILHLFPRLIPGLGTSLQHPF